MTSEHNIISVSGGKQYDFIRIDSDGPMCSSLYGLCE